MRLTIDSRAWQEGFTAGEAGRLASNRCRYAAATTEAWSWYSGWIEGDAKRRHQARIAVLHTLRLGPDLPRL